MRTLGALLAGGRSRRFGSDKAQALLMGKSLLDHGADALRSQCGEFVIAGRRTPGFRSTQDWPGPHMGPLGGIAGALRYAAEHDFQQVLSTPIDCVWLPPDICKLLEPAPAFLASQPVIGLWPVSKFAVLETILLGDDDKSVRAFAQRIGARAIKTTFELPNINSQADLERLSGSLA